MPASSFKQSIRDLLDWYRQNRRAMPWRENPPDPYHVLLSEIMLQQTRIEAVKAHYHAFLLKLPTIQDLAAVDENTLLKLWEGLGYYSRARNLHKTAKIIAEKGFPQTEQGLRALPGIGPYTAAAVASIAFGVPATAIDGNVQRVLSRFLENNLSKEDAAVRLHSQIPTGQAADFTQAWMELGEVLCLPNATPLCEQCPLSSACRAYAHHTTDKYPSVKEKSARPVQQMTVFLLEHQGRFAIRQRPAKGLLASLWEFPNTEGKLTLAQARRLFPGTIKISALPSAHHVFTHLEWDMTNYHVVLQAPLPEFQWHSPQEIEDDFSIPSAFALLKKRCFD